MRELVPVNTPATTKAAANALWEICQEAGYGLVCPMKLQKLVYFAHGWHLAYTGTPLIPDEIEAWNYGPVIESLYGELKEYGSGEITQPLIDVEFIDHKLSVINPTVEDLSLRAFLRNVVGVYGPLTAIQLSKMTHMLGTPWQQMKAAFPTQRNLAIPNELIREYFVTQLPKQA